MPFARKTTLAALALLAGLMAACVIWYVAAPLPPPVPPTPGMDTESKFWIRVLLFDNIAEFSLWAENGFAVYDAQASTTAHFGRNTQAVLAAVLDGRILIGEHVFGSDVEIRPVEPFVFGLNETAWRGNLRLIANAESETMRAINAAPLESYLAGVVGEEMPSYWEGEALKAQTVAARTYCLFIKYRFGVNRLWDVRRTQANQVYGGLAAESPMVWDAIRATESLVLVTRGAEGDSIFPTYYSSTCGGHTENSANVFGDVYAPLEGVPCPYCREVTRPSFFEWSSPAVDAEELSRRIIERYPRFRTLGKIIEIAPDKQSQYDDFSRMASLWLKGTDGRSKSLRAEDLRLTVDPTGTKIRSNSYQIEMRKGAYAFVNGRGFGHAVGLCQYGAEGMARKGADFRKILDFYFPHSKLRSIH
ncbi:MAG: SpoIID/LytB domain-containing protein [Phycisphaerae bacterium]|nr:SpoIID/LytB domain-containing protein [Phycisphaerae bacterium]